MLRVEEFGVYLFLFVIGYFYRFYLLLVYKFIV